MAHMKHNNSAKNRLKKVLSLIILGSIASCGMAATDKNLDTSILDLQHRWAETNYQLEGKAQLKAFEELVVDATRLIEFNADSASVWIWRGIIKSTYAGAKGGLGALGLAKGSKADLEKGIKLDEAALLGSAHTSLGTLYYNVPGWPVGFGNDKKAETHLLRGLEINPQGIDSNYFYALYLIERKRYEDAEKALLKAQNAAPRASRPVADAGRQAEIISALKDVQKLNK